MGIYCSLLCLFESLPRLELLEASFIKRGICLRKLQPDEQPPTLPAAATKGGVLRPVWDVHPDMTVRQALSELKRRTDETICGLDAEGESGSERREQQ
jgi:hypothetical protein